MHPRLAHGGRSDTPPQRRHARRWQYNLAKWLLWRAAYARTDSLIPWGLLAEERAAGYGRVRDYRVVVRGVLDTLTTGLPPVRRAFRAVPRGLKILALDELKRLLKT